MGGELNKKVKAKKNTSKKTNTSLFLALIIGLGILILLGPARLRIQNQVEIVYDTEFCSGKVQTINFKTKQKIQSNQKILININKKTSDGYLTEGTIQLLGSDFIQKGGNIYAYSHSLFDTTGTYKVGIMLVEKPSILLNKQTYASEVIEVGQCEY